MSDNWPPQSFSGSPVAPPLSSPFAMTAEEASETAEKLTPSLSVLTEQTVQRLRDLADGNGMNGDAIQVVDRNENVWTIKAHLRLKPRVDVNTKIYAGQPKGRGLKIMPSVAALESEVERMQDGLAASQDWLDGVVREIKATSGHGWGMDGAVVVVPEQSHTLAASENCADCRGHRSLTCTQCQGEKRVVCSHCRGQGREDCYNCMGRGEDPANPGQNCPVCNGTHYSDCRYCRSTGYLVCPTCRGDGGTPCPECRGTGVITHESVTSGNAEVTFVIDSGSELPSGLLRTMDRLGVSRLSQGHADIEMLPPDLKDTSADRMRIELTARVLYAEIKTRINDHTTMITAFGKRGRLFGVPPFLDDALRPWRNALAVAATQGHSVDDALGGRAIRDALNVALLGKRSPNELRRLYPVGLSSEVAAEIMHNMHRVLQKTTLRTRVIVATVIAGVMIAATAGLFFSPLHIQIARSLPWQATMAGDLVLPLLLAGGGWFALRYAIRSILKRQYPEAKIGGKQRCGKTGYAMVAAIVIGYAVVLAATPLTPEWMMRLLGW